MDMEFYHVINKFFRGQEMPTPELKVLQNNYNKELKEAAGTGKGCSRCKKNSIRRRFKKLIINQLNREP